MTWRNHSKVALRSCIVVLHGLLALPGVSRGQDAMVPQHVAPAGEAYLERDIPRRIAVLELRADAVVQGSDVTLRHVARWPELDEAYFEGVADLVVLRIGTDTSHTTITHEQVRSMLHEAGLNLAQVNFAGALRCTVTRQDVNFDEQRALRAWARGEDRQARPIDGPTHAEMLANALAEQEARLVAARRRDSDDLRSLLTRDVAERLNLQVSELEIEFREQDRPLLAMRRPLSDFAIERQRHGALGDVSWVVTVVSGASTRRVLVGATVRAWQDQVVVKRPIAFRSPISPDMIERRRVLVERLGSDRPIPYDVAVHQAAGRELRPGTVITAAHVRPIELVRAGQLVSVTLRRGGVEVRLTAVASSGGAFGQTITVNNEATRQKFDVVVVGPQMAVGGDAIGQLADSEP